jgi:hypothetical protein
MLAMNRQRVRQRINRWHRRCRIEAIAGDEWSSRFLSGTSDRCSSWRMLQEPGRRLAG